MIDFNEFLFLLSVLKFKGILLVETSRLKKRCPRRGGYKSLKKKKKILNLIYIFSWFEYLYYIVKL